MLACERIGPSLLRGSVVSHQRPVRNASLRAPLTSRTFRRAFFVQSLSTRQIAALEEYLQARLSAVEDKVVGKPLKTLGWLSPKVGTSQDGTLQILLRLPSLLHPQLQDLKRIVQEEAISCVTDWRDENGKSSNEVVAVNVEAVAGKPIPYMARTAEDSEEIEKRLGPGLVNVSHFVAIYSCKGGVGKSTVAVNLAYELARQGGRVGLLDVDVYGPSLPVLIDPKDKAVRRSPKGPGMVLPIEHEGVKVLSLGFVNQNSGVPGSGQKNSAAIMRGPLTVKVVAQLLKGTDWGDLDVLVLDLPPGTGDVQLAICQDLQLSGAVGVTTPSKLALVDTRKGIDMFSSLGVPTFAVVQNMTFFQCEGGKKHYPFGRGVLHNSDTEEERLPRIVPLPISAALSDANESSRPITLQRPPDAEAELDAYERLAKFVSGDLLRVLYGVTSLDYLLVTLPDHDDVFELQSLRVSLDKTYEDEKFVVRLFSDNGAIQMIIEPVDLRTRDPRTGEMMEDSPLRQIAKQQSTKNPDPLVTNHVQGKRSPSIIPIAVERRGNYGYGVEYGDGATIIYSLVCLVKAIGGTLRPVDNEQNI